MKSLLPLAAFIVLFLPACTFFEVEYEEVANEPVAIEEKEEEPIRETKNVSYTGVVQPAGISIYQQGSHRLTLPGGKFVLLEAEGIDLNGYVGEKVDIHGATRPTVEAGGMIMRVERIALVEEKPAEEDVEVEPEEPVEEPVEDESLGETEPENEEENVIKEVAEGIAEETEEVAEEGSEDPEEIVGEEVTEVTQEEAVEEENVIEKPSEAFLENVASMAAQNFDSSHWTQEYCTAHIGFCAPVHRNWWYKSFGATSTALWHVELSGAPLEQLGDGPIVIKLLTGAEVSKDGSVESVNGMSMGYRSWTENRHFTVTADSSLREAVQYITENIVEKSE